MLASLKKRLDEAHRSPRRWPPQRWTRRWETAVKSTRIDSFFQPGFPIQQDQLHLVQGQLSVQQGLLAL